MRRNDLNETVISYARYQPDCGPESPWIVPSEQFRGENPTPPDDSSIIKTANALPDRHRTATIP